MRGLPERASLYHPFFSAQRKNDSFCTPERQLIEPFYRGGRSAPCIGHTQDKTQNRTAAVRHAAFCANYRKAMHLAHTPPSEFALHILAGSIIKTAMQATHNGCSGWQPEQRCRTTLEHSLANRIRGCTPPPPKCSFDRLAPLLLPVAGRFLQRPPDLLPRWAFLISQITSRICNLLFYGFSCPYFAHFPNTI